MLCEFRKNKNVLKTTRNIYGFHGIYSLNETKQQNSFEVLKVKIPRTGRLGQFNGDPILI